MTSAVVCLNAVILLFIVTIAPIMYVSGGYCVLCLVLVLWYSSGGPRGFVELGRRAIDFQGAQLMYPEAGAFDYWLICSRFQRNKVQILYYTQ